MTPTAEFLLSLADGPILSKGAADAAELILVRERVREAAGELERMAGDGFLICDQCGATWEEVEAPPPEQASQP